MLETHAAQLLLLTVVFKVLLLLLRSSIRPLPLLTEEKIAADAHVLEHKILRRKTKYILATPKKSPELVFLHD